MSTLGHQYDNSLVSNAFGFLRLPMNFMPYESDADWFDSSRLLQDQVSPGGDTWSCKSLGRVEPL